MPPDPPVTTTLTPTFPGADLVIAAVRAIDISQVLVASGSLGSLRVADLRLGEATVDRLVVEGVSASVHAGSAFLQDVRILLELKLSVDWWYDIWVWDDSGSQGLGSTQLRDRHRQRRGALAAGHRPVDSARRPLPTPPSTLPRSRTSIWAVRVFAACALTTPSCRPAASASTAFSWAR